MEKRATVYDIADALEISAGTVHRALHDYVGISPATKKKFYKWPRRWAIGRIWPRVTYRKNENSKVSMITLKGTTSFWDEVRAGVEEEAKSLDMEGVEVEFRTYPSFGEGDEEAFEAALKRRRTASSRFPAGRATCANGYAARRGRKCQ